VVAFEMRFCGDPGGLRDPKHRGPFIFGGRQHCISAGLSGVFPIWEIPQLERKLRDLKLESITTAKLLLCG
jgi:hypothetical protein